MKQLWALVFLICLACDVAEHDVSHGLDVVALDVPVVVDVPIVEDLWRAPEFEPLDISPELSDDIVEDIQDAGLPPDCEGDEDCDDDIACTTDSCVRGVCRYVRSTSSCCVDRGDCDDLDACTDDLCVAHTCTHVRLATATGCGCSQHVECHDWLDCSRDECQDSRCVYAAVEAASCCGTDADCDDGDAATDDRCRRWTCEHVQPRPCVDHEGCDDNDPCTNDECLADTCVHVPTDGCCHVDGNCDDGLPSTDDVCVDDRCVFAMDEPPLVCDSDTACDDGNACTVTRCVSGLCSSSIATDAGCCRNEPACDDGDPCTAETCVDFVCVREPVEDAVRQRAWTMTADDFAAFEVENDGSGSVWQLATSEFTSAPTSLYFGRPGDEPLLASGAARGAVTTPPVRLGTALPVELRLLARIDCEPLFSRDQFSIVVVDGDEETTVWSKESIGGATGFSWEPLSASLDPWVGRTVVLSFRFDTIDDVDNAYAGIWVDDVELHWPCEAGTERSSE